MSMRCQKMPGGVPFSTLQATVQALHPTQRSRSITIPYLMVTSSGLVDLHLGRAIEPAAHRIDVPRLRGHERIEMDPSRGDGIHLKAAVSEVSGDADAFRMEQTRHLNLPLHLAAVLGLDPNKV